mgnify:CR=1 FL=1
MRWFNYRHTLDAIFAAILFGLSAPLSKLLLGSIDPIPLASLLYLGAGLGLGAALLWSGITGRSESTEAKLGREDIPWLLLATLTGGVLAPIFLLYGLRSTPAVTVSLLLNFEVVATALIAAWVFREFVGLRAWIAIGFITIGSILLTLEPTAVRGVSVSAILVLAACLMWGLDNNLTRLISLKDPQRIVAVKGLIAGGFSLLLALILRKPFPSAGYIVLGLLLGSMGYGISLALFVRALRNLGTSRTGALFGTAPFIGSGASFLLFREIPSLPFFIAFPLMAGGVFLLFCEQHAHEHVHDSITHDHAHRHDDGHHVHEHAEGHTSRLIHSHRHTHERIAHSHEHRPDIHHRHLHTFSS